MKTLLTFGLFSLTGKIVFLTHCFFITNFHKFDSDGSWFAFCLFVCLSCLGLAQLLKICGFNKYFAKFEKISAINFLNSFSSQSSFSSLGILMMQMLNLLLWYHRSLRFCYFFLSYFPLCCSDWVIYIVLYSTFQIVFSVPSILILSTGLLFWWCIFISKISIWSFFVYFTYFLRISTSLLRFFFHLFQVCS